MNLKNMDLKLQDMKNSLFSIIRKNEYIDFYFFKKTIFGRRCLDYYIPKIFLKKQKKLNYLINTFQL